MKKFTGACAAILAVSTLTLASACQNTDAGPIARKAELTGQVRTIADEANIQGKPALLVVDAPWCGVCKQYKRETLNDPATQAALNERAVYRHVDFDDNKETLKTLGVNSLPTTILIVDGVPTASFTGKRSSDDLIDWLDANAS